MTDSDGPPSQTLERYPSLAAFYNADPARLGSRERDVGLWWREESDGPLHRAAWVNQTGELYLVRLGPVSEGGGTVEMLASVEDSDQLEQLMAGWREHCGEPGSLSWLRERAARTYRRVPVECAQPHRDLWVVERIAAEEGRSRRSAGRLKAAAAGI